LETAAAQQRAATPKKEEAAAAPQTETFHYSVNWPSGLSLGDAQLSASKLKQGSQEIWKFAFDIDASVPGFKLSEHVSSSSGADFCSAEMTKTATRGPRKVEETTKFDQKALTAVRETKNGGKSDVSIPACAKDALTFVFFLRHELQQGRLPAMQKVYYGSGYQTRVEFTGSQTLRIAEGPIEADRVLATMKGPQSETTAEIFFAKDATRTPIMMRVPLAVGKFSMEIAR
jgi:hypothetical protein